MMHHDFLIAKSASYASSVLGMVQERGALSQELVILIILVVIALALILVCGVLGRRETKPEGGGEMGPAKSEPSAATRTETAIWQAGPVAEAKPVGVAERATASVAEEPSMLAESVIEAAEPLAVEETAMPVESFAEVAEAVVVEEPAAPAEPTAEVSEAVAVEEPAAPAESVAEVAEAIVAEQPAAPAEPTAEVSEILKATEAVAAPPRPDDLKVIEGIGPKVARLLNEAGIFTFAQLVEADPAHLKRILEAAKLQMIDPASWPDQARLAAVGDWEALKRMQDNLKGGRR